MQPFISKTFTDTSNKGCGAQLVQASTKGLWSDREKRLHINVLELKAVSLALQRFKDQCQNQTLLIATDNSTVVAYINKQGGTHSAEMCTLLWKIMTWCHQYQITLKARHIPGCLNVMADLLSRSNQVQSTEWSLHPQVFTQIYQKWFTPHVDLFQEQGFSVKVAKRIVAPQRSSIRIIYKSKWAVFEKWCRENVVDFSTPSVKQVSEIFISLYQDINRHPVTINGYSMAIVNTLGPAGFHISQSSDPNFQESSKMESFCCA